MVPTTLRLPWARRAERRKLEAVDEVIGAFGLERFRHHRTSQLSTGTRRVVDLASIVLARPRLLLLDEPTAGIAQREAEAFIPLLRRLHEVADTTIVLVEHDVPLVFDLCSDGRGHGAGPVVASGPPERGPRSTRRRSPPTLVPATRPSWLRVRSERARRRRCGGRAEAKEDDHGSERRCSRHAWAGCTRWRQSAGPGAACAVAPWPCRCGRGHRGAPSWSGWSSGSPSHPRGRRAGPGPPVRPRSAVGHALHDQRDAARAQASTSTRGVTATSINVVFPVVAINSLAGQDRLLAGQGVQRADQRPSHLYVNQINKAGGINGRKINPIIVQFDPTNDANMQALCRQWTQGNPAAFAVVDGIGTWDGRQPALRDPAGPDPAHQRLVHHHQLDQPGLALPVVDGRRHGARARGHRAVGPELGTPRPRQEGRRGGFRPGGRPGCPQRRPAARPQEGRASPRWSRRWPGNPDQTATTNSDAQLAVERFKAAGVQSVFPLVPENAFFPYIGAETSQQYYPQLLLSDYQSTIEVALGLIPVPYEQALDGQEGVTTETLGGFDDARPQSQGGYDPGVRSCYAHLARLPPQAHPRARRASTSRSRGPSRPGAAPSGCSPLRPRTPART